MTKEDKYEFMMETSCHICGESYKRKNEGFKDHGQFTGKYKGSAHKECMLKNRIGPNNFIYQLCSIIYEITMVTS